VSVMSPRLRASVTYTGAALRALTPDQYHQPAPAATAMATPAHREGRCHQRGGRSSPSSWLTEAWEVLLALMDVGINGMRSGRCRAASRHPGPCTGARGRR